MTGRLVVAFLLCLYLITGGGKGYSVDGAFGYEMAKTALLDPQHEYFHRFKTAFARWGALMPVLGQPFVLAGNALAHVAPERDELVVGGHTFRVEEWPVLGAGGQSSYAPPPPFVSSVAGVALISFLANASGVPQGAVVGELRLWRGSSVTSFPIRAGIETAEWAHDRPDVRPTVQHSRPPVAGRWIGVPRGELFYAYLPLAQPSAIDRWELVAREGLGAQGSWQVRAAAFKDTEGAWTDVHTEQRYWSHRQTLDFFTHLLYSTLNAFTTAISAGLIFAILGEFGYSTPVRATAALTFGAATMVWPYAKLDFAEPASDAFALGALWAYYRVFPPQTSPRPEFRSPKSGPNPGDARHSLPEGTGLLTTDHWPLTTRYGLLAGGCLLMAVAGKYTAALMAAAMVGQWLLSSGWWRADRRPAALRFLATMVLPAALLGLAVSAVAFRLTGERPIVLTSGLSRVREDWLALPLWTGLRGLLFSPGKSLFLYSPWLLLAVPGAALWWRRHRRSGMIFAAFPILLVLLYSMKLVWHGGSWGPRYLLSVVPLLCVVTAPVVEWCLSGGRILKLALAGLAVLSVGVQLLAIGKDPEQYPSMVREFVVPALPDLGSRLGGRDYWLARGGPGLSRALQSPVAVTQPRGLGYLWGEPDAQLSLSVSEPRAFTLSLYFVDWEHQDRRQLVTVEDADGRRSYAMGFDFSNGVWASWQVRGTTAESVRVSLEQQSHDTSVVSAAAFGPPGGAMQDQPVVDDRTRGDWRGVYGADGFVFFAFHSFNVDERRLPPYVTRYELSHHGDKPAPLIHVETAEQDLLDTPLLYAAPFSPLLGNAWLLAADGAHLVLPSKPHVADGVLARPPWTWFGIAAPQLPHPEYGLGLDFWPTLLYTNYASFPLVLAVVWLVLGALQLGAAAAAYRLLRELQPRDRRWAVGATAGLAVACLFYDLLQVLA